MSQDVKDNPVRENRVLPDDDVRMQTEQDRNELAILQYNRALKAKQIEEASQRAPLRFGLPPGSAAPENNYDRPPQENNAERKQPEVKQEEEETDAEKAVRRFCKNLIGALTGTNKTKDKEKQIVEINWVQIDTRRDEEDGKMKPVWKKTYPRVPDAEFFNENMDKLFTALGYRMINTALTYIQESFPNNYHLITPFDHISKHMNIFTTLCATLNRVNTRVTHGVNDGSLVVQQSKQTILGCMSHYRIALLGLKR